MWLKGRLIGYPVRLEPTYHGLLILLANHYTTGSANINDNM